jgi:hypothetical protein
MSARRIIIAGPSANTGKTALACRIISATPGAQALKITRFHRESHCPVHGVNEQGEDDCDGCAPAPSGFELVEDAETLNTPGKDSARMIEAGAEPVYWLRAAPHVFRYALSHAMKRYDPGKPLVLEGNSAATVSDFEGTVVVLWPQKTRGVKASVFPALKRADVLVLVEDEGDQPRRWPKTLKAALKRQGMDENDLPAPLWLPAGWWQETPSKAEIQLIERLSHELAIG